MKTWPTLGYAICLLLAGWACSRETLNPMPDNDGLKTYMVKPSTVQPDLTEFDKAHYAYFSTSADLRHELLVFLGGTYSKPQNYQNFPAFAAGLGYHVINLAYPNDPSVQVCAEAESMDCFADFREEILYGTAGSAEVSVDALNSIWGRLEALLNWLHQQSPEENWGQFLSDTGMRFAHDQIALAGHSQGAGHAAYWGMQHAVARVLMFSGPNDYSARYSQAAEWAEMPFATPTARHFGFLHRQDEVIPYGHQTAFMAAAGLADSQAWVSVDEDTWQGAGSRFFYTEGEPASDQVGIAPLHSLPVSDTRSVRKGKAAPRWSAVWEFMLTN